MNSKYGLATSRLWSTKSTSARLIMIGAFCALLAPAVQWESRSLSNPNLPSYLTPKGDSISMFTLMVLIGCWSYPLYLVAQDLKISRKAIFTPAIIISFWMIQEIVSMKLFPDTMSVITGANTSMGPGMWLGSISAVLLVWAAMACKSDQLSS